MQLRSWIYISCWLVMPILHKRRLCQSWERLFPLQFMRWWTCPAAFTNPVWGPSVHLQQTYWTNSLCFSAAGHGTIWVAWWDSEEFACRSSISAKVPGTFYKPKIPYTILRPTRNHVKHLYIFFSSACHVWAFILIYRTEDFSVIHFMLLESCFPPYLMRTRPFQCQH